MNLNTELTKKETPLVLQYCNAIGIRYETSGAYHLRHIEFLNITPSQRERLEIFLERLEQLETEIKRSVKRG